MLIRYRIVAETTDNSFPFGLTQEDLAQATGMTTVHANRILQQLRSEGLIDLRGRTLTVLDPKRLRKAAHYETNYLHLVRTEERDREVSDRAGDLVAPTGRGLLHDAVEKVKDAFK
jgi:DNA-binding IclR family transcriptional regulator